MKKNNIINLLDFTTKSVGLSKKELLNKKKNKDVLISVIKHIASINNRKELFSVIINELQSIIPIDDTAIIVLNEDGTMWQDWTNVDNYQETEDIKKLQDNNSEFLEFLPHHKTMEECFKQTGVHTIDHYLNGGHPFAPLMYDNGFREFMFTPLVFQGKTIGCLFFDSKEYGTYSEEYFEIFEFIAYKVSSAVANILAKEEILERESEKTVLLSLNQDMCNIRNRNDLLDLMLKKIKPIIHFDDAVISKYSDDYNSYFHIVTASPPERKAHPMFTEVVGKIHPVIGNPDEYVLDNILNQDVLRYDTSEIIEMYPDHFIGHFLKENNLFFNLYLKLMYGGTVIGFMNFHFSDESFLYKQKFSLYKSISEQISVALANILANEEIMEREREKSQLLEISEAIAAVQNSKQLLKVIYEKIKPVLQYDSAGLFILDKEGNNCYEITDDEVLTDDALQKEITKRNLLGPFPMTEFTKDFWFNYEKPTITTIKQQAEYVSDIVGKAQFEIGIAYGLKDFICGPLNCAGKKIGMLCFSVKKENYYTDKDLPLFKSISDLIAVAVANILANQEIENQLIEIKELKNQLEAENVYLQQEVKNIYNFDEIIGQSEVLHEAFEKTNVVALTDASVLLLGETGTGKELFARAIHNASKRQKKALIKINCAALPPQLIESELFGHERGSFTGAFEKRIGKFELAHESTLFLDEIGELPLDLQGKLLRALQEKEIERLGSNKVITTDVRIITATNRDLEKEVAEGRFRADLFFRLNVFPISLPALRDREEDIPLLVNHFIAKFGKKFGKSITGISSAAMQSLKTYSFPGNVRELEHILERSAILTKTPIIKDVYLPKSKSSLNEDVHRVKSHQEQERDYIEAILKKCNGKIFGHGCAAELLDLPPTTLISKMKKLGIKK